MARWQNVNGIYQIYPRSFKDSNGDGIGDLAGIIEKLDYIKGTPNSLGIDAIWLSPFYRSPMADFGYDISDYYSVDPLFGDLEDFKRLITEAHERDIKVMIDFVPNHTSDEHPWFIASKSSRDNEKRDWYVWRDPKANGSPPNNWLSVFGGSAWQFDEATGQYYLHSFLTKQPDLNWENPSVRKAMTDVLIFWLSLGVDGIRADAVRWISKDPGFQDNPLNESFQEGDDPYYSQHQRYNRYGVNLFKYLREIAAVVERYTDRIILFEDYLDESLDSHEQYSSFYAVNPVVAAPFNFEGMSIPYGAQEFRRFIGDFQNILGSELRPFYCFSNHDKPRMASRFGPHQAKLVTLLQLTLPGIPVIYYGDELGMKNTVIPSEIVQDPLEILAPGLGLGRDPERTPMQWSDKQYAGFSPTMPWLPVADDFATINATAELDDVHSLFNMYRSLLELRRSSTLLRGSYVEWQSSNDSIFGYIRQDSNDTLLVLLNMSSESVECNEDVEGEIIYSTHATVESADEGITLLPHQGLVIRRGS